MRFYTNVQMIGNNFLVRGYEDGRKVMFQEKYQPYSLCQIKERDQVENT